MSAASLRVAKTDEFDRQMRKRALTHLFGN